VFCAIDKAIYLVPNKWCTHGWTTFELKNLSPEIVLDALDTAYKEAMKPKASKKWKRFFLNKKVSREHILKYKKLLYLLGNRIKLHLRYRFIKMFFY
jgi:hypothetical protein